MISFIPVISSGFQLYTTLYQTHLSYPDCTFKHSNCWRYKPRHAWNI